MKKALIALTLALAILCCAAAACAEGDVKRDQLKVGLRMNVPGKTGATMEAGDTVQIALQMLPARISPARCTCLTLRRKERGSFRC